MGRLLLRVASVGVHHVVIVGVSPFPPRFVVPEKDRHRADIAHVPVVLLRFLGPFDVVVEGVRPLDGVENSLEVNTGRYRSSGESNGKVEPAAW